MPSSTTEWLTRTKVRKWIQRIVFFLLAVWLHCALLFFLVMDLFKGHENNTQGEPSSIQHQIIEVHLQPAIAPREEASIPQPEPQAPAPVQSVDDSKTPKTTESAPLDKHVEPRTEEHGILSCGSLTKKPERIIYGEDKVQYMPDEGNATGYVILRETISRTGSVINVAVEESTLSKKLEEQTVTWAYRKIYHPGEIGGVAVDCESRYMVSASQP